MKKLVFLFIVTLSSAASMFAGCIPKNPACTEKSYPDLYDGAGRCDEKLENGDVIHFITMTIPFSKVTYTGKGAMYYITHPIPGNECSETADKIFDNYSEGIRDLVEMAAKYPNALSHMDVSIQKKYINGVTDGKWEVIGLGKPNNPENYN